MEEGGKGRDSVGDGISWLRIPNLTTRFDVAYEIPQ